GVVLMAAMLITPAAAARFWSDNLIKIVIISAVFGAFSGLSGAFISYMAPAMPTGPWMVGSSSCIAFFSFFFAPGKGSVRKWWRKKQHIQTTDEENILKIFYQLGELQDDYNNEYSLNELMEIRTINRDRFTFVLKRLKRKGLVELINGKWLPTIQGIKESERIVRLHRLWELYLTNYMQMPAHKVHENAEMIEHILTPEIERELEIQLGFPERDPHQSIIPRI